ncbi:putative disease resistance protein RGA3 isoform X1 [Cinnamomum micranthum f. kanehirae]|uniref:Putative disease resistance protein RGA3 isoform X1 n=1 Tax=Cinnamomum micranthum f. kanehirae TaxID=337451 RepID=A0A3S3MXQ6_9MAGN|nr:putative disease resistance protein RGA3 isoform X1 [Cinnamomum micranthum f. kanehirae]
MAELLSKLFDEFLSKLSSGVENELRLLLGLEKEKQKLGSNMSRITAMLQDAESRRVLDESSKDWLRKLKVVVYDAEDLLDELVVEDQRRKVENEDGMGKKVCNFFSPLNPLCFRLKIAHKIQELRDKLDALAKENKDFSLMGGVVSNQSLISDERETSSKVIPSETCGRDDEKEELIDSLLNSGNAEVLSVIPIVGMGGLGKTTLAQLVYSHERVVTHFGLRMWVYVSDQDFIVKRLLEKILKSANDGTVVDQLSMDQIMTRLEKELSGKRYLLVLDDVWNEDYHKWDELKTVLKCGAIGSKILVTTRNDKVAEIMDALPRPPLGTLSPVESWTLFEKVAHPPTRFVSIGEEIVRRCGGVPLAIKTLGGMLRNETSEREWQSVTDSELWKRTDKEGRVLSILRLSYDHLTSSLKQCFVYCAVIPKGRQFYKDGLIKKWIAQGFIHSDDENELLEEEGEKYFNALLRRSLFQVDVETASNDAYKMHDLIHDLLRSVAGKECFVVEASMKNDLTHHLALCNDETRHLVLCNAEWAGEPKNLDALKKCKKLRSMITYVDIDINICLSFTCLRVLDVSSTMIRYLPNSIDKLRHLRYFDISDTEITELPETICNLHSLQTLILLGIRLERLPKNMKRMISLRHIEFEGGDDFPLPEGIGELTFLRTLPKFFIAKESGARIEELKGLNLLWRNIHIGGLDNIRNGRCAGEADLKAKKHVDSLKLSWSGDATVAAEGNAKEVIEVLEPNSDLKELSVANYTGLEFPSWMTQKLTNLKKISLSSCKRCEQLPPLGRLHFLESLEIYQMDAVKYIVEFDESHNYKDLFPSLKDLDLRNIPNLEGWSSPQKDGDGDEQGRERYKQVIFKCLRTLKIHDCPKLARPPRLPLLPSLESLEIGGMCWDMIQIPTSQSLMKVKLNRMPDLERWSPHEADDGTPVIFYPIRTLSISNCPKLICLPMFLLPALEELEMSEVGCEKIELSRSHSLKRVDLERWSLQEVDDDKDEQVTFRSLRTLSISKCPKLIFPHQLLLPALEELEMKGVGCEKIEFSTSKSLKRVELRNMPNLERLSPQEADDDEQVVFPGLVELGVEECPRMVCFPHLLPSLKKLKICESNEMLLASVTNYTSLSALSIIGLREIKHLPKELGPNYTSLRILMISNCPKLISLSNLLENLLALKELMVIFCNDLILSLPDGLQQQQRLPPLNSLEVLEIRHSCEKQTSLPGDGIVLTSLRKLEIHYCENIESFSADMLKNLTKLSISNSPKVWSSLVSLENLNSLEHLRISGCPEPVMMKLLESMENLTSLVDLWIEDCPGMRSLPESVKNLTSLTQLRIEECPDMRSLPKGLQHLKNLKQLSISGCPVLRSRLQYNKGQDLHKVAHVRYVDIDEESDISDSEGEESDISDSEWEESSDVQCPHPLLHSLKKLEKLPLPFCSSSPSSPPPPST